MKNRMQNEAKDVQTSSSLLAIRSGKECGSLERRIGMEEVLKHHSLVGWEFGCQKKYQPKDQNISRCQTFDLVLRTNRNG